MRQDAAFLKSLELVPDELGHLHVPSDLQALNLDTAADRFSPLDKPHEIKLLFPRPVSPYG